MGHIFYNRNSHFIGLRFDAASRHDYYPWVSTYPFNIEITSVKKRIGFLNLLAIDYCLTNIPEEPERNIFDQFAKTSLYNEIVETGMHNAERYRIRYERAKRELKEINAFFA